MLIIDKNTTRQIIARLKATFDIPTKTAYISTDESVDVPNVAQGNPRSANDRRFSHRPSASENSWYKLPRSPRTDFPTASVTRNASPVPRGSRDFPTREEARARAMIDAFR